MIQTKKKPTTWGLIIALIVVVFGSILFVGAVAGWFSQPQEMVLDAEYQGKNESFSLSTEEYEQMVQDKKSFIVIAYLPTCTANIIKYMEQYTKEYNISYFYLNWSDLRETSLKDVVKFSPSVILVSRGQPIAYLKADSDEDTDKYNNYETFKDWMNKWIDYKK